MSLDHYQGHRYNQTGTVNEYDLISGVHALPVAEDQDDTDPNWSPVDLVVAHAPYRVRRLQFRAEKHASPPVMPSPTDSGAFKFLTGTLYFLPPRIDSNGEHLTWSSYGNYTFIENCRSSLQDGFVLGLNVPFATTFNKTSASVGQTANTQQRGAIAAAGNDAQYGYSISQEMSIADPTYSYDVSSFVPATFFDSGMVNGQVELPQQQLPNQQYPPGSFTDPESGPDPSPHRRKPPEIPRPVEPPC